MNREKTGKWRLAWFILTTLGFSMCFTQVHQPPNNYLVEFSILWVGFILAVIGFVGIAVISVKDDIKENQ